MHRKMHFMVLYLFCFHPQNTIHKLHRTCLWIVRYLSLFCCTHWAKEQTGWCWQFSRLCMHFELWSLITEWAFGRLGFCWPCMLHKWILLNSAVELWEHTYGRDDGSTEEEWTGEVPAAGEVWGGAGSVHTSFGSADYFLKREAGVRDIWRDQTKSPNNRAIKKIK